MKLLKNRKVVTGILAIIALISAPMAAIGLCHETPLTPITASAEGEAETETSYTVTVETNDANAGTTTKSEVVTETETKVTLEAAASKLGYTWLGWYDGEKLLTDETTYTFAMPAENVIYTAKWKVNDELLPFIFTSTQDTLTITGVTDKTVTEIVVPDYVTSIAQGAFSGCSSLDSITIPFVGGSIKTEKDTWQFPFGYIFGTESYTGGVATTQYYYGSSTSSSTSATYYIPSSLKSVTVMGGNILYGAFYNCSSLTSVMIPSGVTSIGNYAFYNCSNLTGSVKIPDSVISIGSGAFSYCSSLTSVTIPSSVTSIGNYVFENCSGLTSVTIPNNVTSIGVYAFYGCSGLTSVTIPDSVTSIGSYAFYGCSGLTSMTIPDSVTSIGIYAFYGCSGLTSMKIPNSVTNIEEGAFSGCSSLTSIEIDKENTQYSSIDGVLFNKTQTRLICYPAGKEVSYIIPNSVTSIGNGAFRGCDSLTSVTIPNSVTSIGERAFMYCSSLTSVTIPDSVTSIGSSAFYGCSSLESITIPFVGASKDGTSNTHFGYIFGANGYSNTSSYVPTSLKIVIITNATTIGYGTFNDCRSLTSVTIPNSVTSIGERAFMYCSSLTSVTIPNSVTSIGSSAFFYCSGLTSVTIGNSVTSIGSSAFYECSSLTSVTIPNSVTSIGDYAFEYCSKLASVTIPSSVTSIGNGVFYRCSSLTSVAIPSSVTSIGSSAFYYCSSLKSVTIPSSVTSIGSSAFRNCSSLTSITIPNSVTSIGEAAFYECSSLTSMTIGNSVKSIENNAFRNCSSLTSVYISDIAAWCNISFDASSSNPLCYKGGNLYLNGKLVTELEIPSSVTSIGDYAFYYCNGLTSVTIPNSVTSIGNGAFFVCNSLTSVYYAGTAEKWDEISIGSSNTYLTNATRYYYSEEHQKDGNWWLYVNGVPQVHKEGVNGSCVACGEFIGNVRCDAAALALEGQIGLVFYYRFSDEVLADKNAYVLFTYENGTEVKYLVSQMTVNNTKEYVRYRVVCEMAAQDMFQTITTKVVYTIDGTPYTSYAIEYGVMTYYENMYKTDSKELDDLLDSLLAYGEKARNYFQKEEANTYPVKDVTEEALSKYEMTSEGTLPSAIKKVSASLILESTTSIKVYIEGDITNCVVTVDSKEVQPTLNVDGRYVVLIDNIVSSELEHIYTISISDGKDTKTFTYSALTYALNELSSDDQNSVQLVSALYYYNQAADAYFK
jgi:uncharacterized repeat protein (TIGR02543 family)